MTDSPDYVLKTIERLEREITTQGRDIVRLETELRVLQTKAYAVACAISIVVPLFSDKILKVLQ